MFTAKLVTSNLVNVIIDNRSYVVDMNNANFKNLRKAVLENDSDLFLELYNAENSLVGLITGVVVENGEVKYNGQVLSNEITEDILSILNEGYDASNIIKFLENLMQNPSNRAITELYIFLKQLGLSVTEDGCFLAYKCVRDNYLDKFSGTYSNHIGAVMDMPRNEVDDDCNVGCSHGFHVGSLQYSGPNGTYYSDGDAVIIVKVNPKDVVSIPTDCSFQKCRVCHYSVIGDYENPLEKKVYTGQVGNNKVVEQQVELEDLEVGNIYRLIDEDGHEYTILIEHLEWVDYDSDEGFIQGEILDPPQFAGRSIKFYDDEVEVVYRV